MLVGRPDEPPQTRSELERQFLTLCRDCGLPVPRANARLHGFEVDALWHAERLVVELDGRAYHNTRAAFERDRVRDATLQLHGFRVVRITHHRLTHTPEVVIDTLRALLGRSARSLRR